MKNEILDNEVWAMEKYTKIVKLQKHRIEQQ